MHVRLTHDIDKLAAKYAAAPAEFLAQAHGVVERHVNEGNRIAQRLARERSGPHGANYWKRLSGEMTGALEGEYGPHDGGTPVGAGFRTDGPNLDLPNSADLIGPKLADALGDLAERVLR